MTIRLAGVLVVLGLTGFVAGCKKPTVAEQFEAGWKAAKPHLVKLKESAELYPQLRALSETAINDWQWDADHQVWRHVRQYQKTETLANVLVEAGIDENARASMLAELRQAGCMEMRVVRRDDELERVVVCWRCEGLTLVDGHCWRFVFASTDLPDCVDLSDGWVGERY